MPIFVAELISDSSRTNDEETKRTLYASVGIQEYLVVDLLTLEEGPWQVTGYRLGESPYYEEIPKDADGGVSFQGVRLRFVPVDRTRIDIYDMETGERLLNPTEMKARADAEAARADAEAARAATEAMRADAEATRADAEAKARANRGTI